MLVLFMFVSGTINFTLWYLHSPPFLRSLYFATGHYYAYFCNFEEQQWYKLDDSVVSKMKQETVLDDAFQGESCAYMLQYARCASESASETLLRSATSRLDNAPSSSNRLAARASSSSTTSNIASAVSSSHDLEDEESTAGDTHSNDVSTKASRKRKRHVASSFSSSSSASGNEESACESIESVTMSTTAQYVETNFEVKNTTQCECHVEDDVTIFVLQNGNKEKNEDINEIMKGNPASTSTSPSSSSENKSTVTDVHYVETGINANANNYNSSAIKNDVTIHILQNGNMKGNTKISDMAKEDPAKRVSHKKINIV